MTLALEINDVNFLQKWITESRQLLLQQQNNPNHESRNNLTNSYINIALQNLDFLNSWIDTHVKQNKLFSLREFYLAWLDYGEQVYLQLLATSEFQQNLANWVNQLAESK